MIVEMPRAQASPKLANTILYLLERCGHAPPGKQALLKMLWYADYWHYQENLSVITGADYVAMTNGPVIDNYQNVLNSLAAEGVLRCEEKPVYGKPRMKEEYSPLVDADASQFTATELRTLDRVIKECAGRSGAELSRRTHLDGPWLLVWNDERPNQPIHRVLFRWVDNLPDEDDHRLACTCLARADVRRDLEALAS